MKEESEQRIIDKSIVNDYDAAKVTAKLPFINDPDVELQKFWESRKAMDNTKPV